MKNLENTKKSLRKFALEKRALMAKSGAIKLYSSKVTSKILASLDFQKAQHAALYFPIKNEIDITGLLNIEGKDFYFPRCKGLDLEFIKYTNNDNIIKGKYDILEPKGNAINPKILDIIYVPALMANKNNYRLGYGKGYYDRFFSKNKNVLKAKKVIIAVNELVSDIFFEDKNDIKCDYTIS